MRKKNQVSLNEIISEQLRQYFHLWDLAPQIDKAVPTAKHKLARPYCGKEPVHITKARGQVVLVLLGLLCWLPFTSSVLATVLALIWYGLAGPRANQDWNRQSMARGSGGPLVTYASTLLNQHCIPTGFQLAASWHLVWIPCVSHRSNPLTSPS